MGEDAKMPKELEKFEDYYMRTMEITGSRDNFPKDPQLVKDVINLFLQQNPRVSQVDIATKYELAPSLFSRFLRTDNVKSKAEWNRVAYRLGLDIDLARYIRNARELIELIWSWQQIYYGEHLTRFIDGTFETAGLIPYSPKHLEDTEDSEKSYENMRYFLINSTNEEAWFFYYFKGRDTLASDVVFNLLSNENISTVHMIIILNSENAFEDVKQTFRRKDWRNSLRYASLTVLRVDDEITSIFDEYSDGDLGLKKRSEQGSGTNTAPSATPQ